MTTREYLRNIESLNVKIRHRVEDITKLKESVQPATTKIKTVNVQENRQSDKVSAVVVKIISLEEEINKLIDRRYYIIRQIESLEDIDARLYDILAQKYIECLPIASIKIRNIKSDASKKRILADAMREFERRYGSEYLNTKKVQNELI